MRPFRLLLSLFTCVIAVTLLLYAKFPATAPAPVQSSSSQPSSKKGKLSAFFSWTAPSSLFPPTAIISLTDDNSTFFLARPAAFGPALPPKGLSGPLWVGSGFGDDSLTHGGLVATLEGELGCSDAPGWNEGSAKAAQIGVDARRKSLKDPAAGPVPALERKRRALDDLSARPAGQDSEHSLSPLDENDGTDDYLHRSLADPNTAKVTLPAQAEHADIQSLQEGAEIAGKVVLLSRGGCGFLEKAKWVQRRGGTALIVGDNIRGGPLITMYAHGDTSNITIPALFTSHTTAHLLSSLMPSGGFIDSLSPGDATKMGAGSGKKTDNTGKNKEASKAGSADKPVFTDTNSKARPTSISKPKGQSSPTKSKSPAKEPVSSSQDNVGWFRAFLSFFGFSANKQSKAGGDSRPPSSGHLDWVLVEDFVDEQPDKDGSNVRTTVANAKAQSKPTTHASDNFVIGVQDWRDPDLLPQQTGAVQNKLSDPKQKSDASHAKPKGGSVLPGSGEYEKPTNDVVEVHGASSANSPNDHHDGNGNHNGEERGWLSSLQWGHDNEESKASSSKRKEDLTEHPNFEASSKATDVHKDSSDPPPDVPNHHEGLWVTLTPTSISSSPFFDTLLVLVVSPLVTLTVVYALLLLRSRIRRRRWRAPKSVVDRLPIRTYHTLPSDSSSPAATPVSSSPTTPLLSQHPTTRSTSSRSRPRSRTASEVPAQASSSFYNRSHLRSPSPETEKREAGLAEWRRRYGGRQKECVVCLEEYVDGVSRVMSLPCGHEFHAECITPWLTTRRRTCPICKGDVVRSLQRTSSSLTPNASSSPSSASPIHRAAASSPPHPDLGLSLGLDHSDDEDVEDAIQDVAVLSHNDNPGAALPIIDEDYDIERADGVSRDANNDTTTTDTTDPTVWRTLEISWQRISSFVNDAGTWAGRGRRREVFDRDR